MRRVSNFQLGRHIGDDLGYEIAGPVDAVDGLSLTVVGVTCSLDVNTFFESGTAAIGDYVEIEDDNGDGSADTVEIDD